MKKLLLLTLLLCAVLQAGAETWTDSDGVTWTYTLSGSNAIITKCSKTSGSLAIPNKVNGYTVTSIGKEAFYGCSGLTSVTIPECVTSIGNGAFRLCSHLTSVEIPDGVTSIGMDAFRGCSGLTSVTIPEGVTSIGGWAFKDCSGLTSVTIGEGVTSIGDYAFKDCSRLTSVTINSNAIMSQTYSYSSSLGTIFGNQVKEYIIGEGVTSIGEMAFYNCSSLTSVTIPSSVTSIGSSAFYDCSGLTSVTIPSSVTSIGNYAFYHCTGLTSVTIPEGVTSIGNNAFAYCSSLTSVTIPSSVTSISYFPFNGCSGLTSIKVNSGNTVYDSRNSCNAIIEKSTNRLIVGCKNTVIPNTVTSIGNSAFYGCSGLTSVTIPSSVTSIGKYAFYDCTGLTSVTIPSSVTSIGDDAFNGCSGLTSVTIPSSVTSIGDSAFARCSGLTSVTIPSSVTSISDYAFSSCSGLSSVTIPEGVTSIGNYAFSGCSGLTSVTIPSSVTSIGKSVFYNCSGLTSVTIPESVTSIGKEVFRGCSGLKSVTIPSSVTSIGEGAFSGCTGLTNVTINSNAIMSKTYSTSSNLGTIFGNQVKEYIIGESVTSIGNYAFQGCSGLTSVTIPSSVTSIGEGAFSGCSGLTSVVLPSNLSSIIQSSLPNKESCKIYVNRGAKTLFTLWYEGYTNVYFTGTEEKALKPELSLVSATQSTLTVRIEKFAKEFRYECNEGVINEETFVITSLRPDAEEAVTVNMSLDDKTISLSKSFKTEPLSLKIDVKDINASSFSASGSYQHGDANVSAESIKLYKTEVKGSNDRVTGLNPNTSYTVTYKVKVAYGKDGEKTYVYSTSKTVSTSPLTLTTSQPKVVSIGNVIVAAVSNLDDAETNVGFEWRRTDWTDDFQSNTGIAYLYEGTMEGYIRNLNTDKLWKFRPFYISSTGNYYYGEWMGLDPTNTSYFEPSVHTYPQIEVTGNTALVKGFALGGTDQISVQGFKYWKNTNHANSSGMAQAPSVPSNAQTVEAEGRIMEAALSGLDYGSEYSYVAFVKTTEGETFYGDVRTFTTEGNAPSGISEMRTDDNGTGEVHEVARYNLRGQRLDSPERGINIVKMSDGTTRKILVK